MSTEELMMPMFKVNSRNILELLKKGIITCVTNQDWTVNRIAPDFLNASAFKKHLSSGEVLLHLGIGNGECYNFFNINNDFNQISISDKLYFDPYEIIKLFLLKCGLSDEDASKLGLIIRNEFLIAISYKDLFENNKCHFTLKDVMITNILKSDYDITKSYSYNILTLLLHLLNSNVQLLFPICIYEQRILNPMGKKIELRQIDEIDYTNMAERLNNTITLNDVKNYLLDRFLDINNIYLIDFMSLNLPTDIKFDYILATRSDAFLKKDYYNFLVNIVKHLTPNGYYISDGIVSCYDYKLFYPELIKAVKVIGERRVLLICSPKKSDNIPLRDIVGIVVLGCDASIADISNFINPKQIIHFTDVTDNTNFIRQCAWTNIVEWSREHSLDIEKIEKKKISEIINEYIILNGKLNFTILPQTEKYLFKTFNYK